MGRVKDTHNHGGIDLEGLSPEMKAFRQELEQKFPNIRYTSGKRDAEQGVGKYSNTSHHNTGNALDIGAEHKEVYEYLWNDPEGLALLNKHGLGLINETDPETMKKTGATGAHYHIGKDSKYVAEANKRYAELSGNTQGQVQQQEDGSFVYIPSTHGYSEIPTTLYADFTKDLEKEKKKEEKAQEEEKTEEVTEIEQAREVASKLFAPQEQEQPKQKEGQQAPEIKTDFIDMPDVATSLPSLPSITTLPEFKDGGKSNPFITKLNEEDEKKFRKFFETLPNNLQQGLDDPTYDIRGYWDAEGRPEEFDYSQPTQEDGYYHAYSINPNTGEYLKAPWHKTFQKAIEMDRSMGYRPIGNIAGRVESFYNESLVEPEEDENSLLENRSIVSTPKMKQGGVFPNIFDNSTDSTISYKRKYFADGGNYGEPIKPKQEVTVRLDKNTDSSYYDPLTDEIIATERAINDPDTLAHEYFHKWQRDTGRMRMDPLTPKQTPVIPNSDEVVYDFYNRRGNEHENFTEYIDQAFPDLTGNIWTKDMNLISPEFKSRVANDLLYMHPGTAEGEAEYRARTEGLPENVKIKLVM